MSKSNLIGVNIKAMRATVDSVPYVTHFDYIRQVKELTEFADYAVINLEEDIDSSGI